LRVEIDIFRRKCISLSGECARLDTAKRLAECEAAAHKNAWENSELRARELKLDVEKLRRVEGEVRLLCESQEKCRHLAGELALLRQEAEQKEAAVALCKRI